MSAIGLLTGQLADVRAQLKAAQDGWGRTANDLASETQRANRAERSAERHHAYVEAVSQGIALVSCPVCTMESEVAKAAEEPDFAIRALRIFRKALNELYREEQEGVHVARVEPPRRDP